jgi:histidine triad (HIT) family protein
MSDLTPEQKKVLEEQKANCPFCQIISGKIPATKVYEDSKIIAILDINPARDGHLLVMTKEHYPILPLIPKDEFDALFSRLKDIIEKTKKGVLLCDSANYFIANGGAAGQQAPHFMIHVIPRDPTDTFTSFELKKKQVDPEKVGRLSTALKVNLPKMMGERFEKHKIEEAHEDKKEEKRESREEEKKENRKEEKGSGNEEHQKIDLSSVSKEDIMRLLENNPMLKDIIENAPNDAKEVIKENPTLAKIFLNVDIDALSKQLKKNRLKKHKSEKNDEDGTDGAGNEDNEDNIGDADDEDKDNEFDGANHSSGDYSDDKGNLFDDDKPDLDAISKLF